MKNKHLLKNVSMILILVLMLAACKQDEQARFDDFLDRLAKTTLENSPLTATFTLGDLEAAGFLDLAADIDHLDIDDLYAQIDQMKKDYEELLTINKDLLTSDQQVNYELAKFNLSFAEESKDFIYMDHLIQPSAGVQVNFPLALMQIEFESRNELDAFVERVSKIPRLFDEVIAYEQERFEQGYGLPGHLYQEVVDQIDAMLGQPEEFMMYLSFVDRIDAFEGLSDEERDKYKADYLTLISDEIYPAMERLKAQAEAMVSSSNTGSISQLEDGKDYYESIVNYKTAGELDVKGLKEWSDEQMNQIIGDVQLLMKRNPEVAEMDLLSELPNLTSIDEVYDLVDEIYTDQFEDYGTVLASENVIPSYLEEYLATGFYFPVTVDGEDYGNMFLQKDDYDNVSIETVHLFYHENIPGHHLYYSYIADSDQPLYRKMNEFLTYEEGWATYVQNLFFNYLDMDPLAVKLIEINLAYTNVLMVQLDIQFHYDGMTEDQAIEQLVLQGYDEESAQSIVTRMISKPGEMIHYMYGEYKMQQLKDMFKEVAGSNYSDKAFHDFILKNYGLPFYLVEEQLETITF